VSTSQLFDRVKSLGGLHHLSRPRSATTTLLDQAEALATLLHSTEGRLQTIAPSFARTQVSAVTGLRGEMAHPSADFDLAVNRPWSILALLVGSLQGAEAAVAVLTPGSVAPQPVATIDPSQPDSFAVILNDVVARSLAVDVGINKLITSKPAA
jgi:hypothetical protein